MKAVTRIQGPNLYRIAPTFLVVRNIVHLTMSGFKREMVVGDVQTYRKHGWFSPEYIGDSYAIIHHNALNGKMLKIFIPPGKRVYISNGRWCLCDVNYESFRKFHLKTTQR